MAPPPAKKQKVESLPKSPIIFQSPGLKPDVSLKVFDVDFYVHSIVLKLHSAFFRKFLDSANKAALPSNIGAANLDASGSASDGTTPPEASATWPSTVSGAFKYKWVTKIDQDEEDKWHLVSDNPKNEPFNVEKYKGDQIGEVVLFETLLCAIYNRPYHIKDIEHFLGLTDLATYYCVLPAVSGTLLNALHESQEFTDSIHSNPCAIFEAAAKLRHKVLFREALIWVVGNWTQPQIAGLSDRRLRHLAQNVYGEISTMVSKATSRIIDVGLLARGPSHWLTKVRDGIRSSNHEEQWKAEELDLCARPQLNLPKFFRNIADMDDLPGGFEVDDLCLTDLLMNNLVLDGKWLIPGEDSVEDYFLCAAIKDEDLPWNLEEIDW